MTLVLQRMACVMSQDYVAARTSGRMDSASEQSHGVDVSPEISSFSGSGRRQAGSTKAEELHEQQALLNQLKEVPVKGMNASLLVAPLMDHGRVLVHCQSTMVREGRGGEGKGRGGEGKGREGEGMRANQLA